jgi:hypothetical protein
MQQFIIIAVISFIKTLPASSPAYMDILKLIVGSFMWIGGLVGYMWWREKNLKPAASK